MAESASAPPRTGAARGGRGRGRGRGRGGPGGGRGGKRGGAAVVGAGAGAGGGTGGKMYFSKVKIADGSAINRPGVFVSCDRGREKGCESELYGLFNSIADELYPDAVFDDEPAVPASVSAPAPAPAPAHPAWLLDDAPTGDRASEASEDLFGEREEGQAQTAAAPLSFEEELARELSDLKRGKDIERFYSIPTATDCTIFIAMKAPLVPSRMCLHYLRQVRETGIARLRYALRLVPVDAVGPANLRTIEERVPGLCEGFFAPGTGREIEGKTWRIVYNSRSSPKISRQAVCEHLPKAVPAGLSVNLSRSDYVVLVEVFKSIMGISIVDEYDELKRYNVQEVVGMVNGAKTEAGELSRAGKQAQPKAVLTADDGVAKTSPEAGEEKATLVAPASAPPADPAQAAPAPAAQVSDADAAPVVEDLHADIAIAAAEEDAVNAEIGGLGEIGLPADVTPVRPAADAATAATFESQVTPIRAPAAHPIPQKPAADVVAAAEQRASAERADSNAVASKTPAAAAVVALADASASKKRKANGVAVGAAEAANSEIPAAKADKGKKNTLADASLPPAGPGMGMAPKREVRGAPGVKTGTPGRGLGQQVQSTSTPPQSHWQQHIPQHATYELPYQPNGGAGWHAAGSGPMPGPGMGYAGGASAWQPGHPGQAPHPPQMQPPWQVAQPMGMGYPPHHLTPTQAWQAGYPAGPPGAYAYPGYPPPHGNDTGSGAELGYPPAIPYASRPGGSGSGSGPYPSPYNALAPTAYPPGWLPSAPPGSSSTMKPTQRTSASATGKPKKPPAWKRGEPVKRDRRDRCWHCGAGREHAAPGVVERDGGGEEAEEEMAGQAAQGKRKLCRADRQEGASPPAASSAVKRARR